MKRIVAREFLLLVGCLLAVAFVGLFGWMRNMWFQQCANNTARQTSSQVIRLDSLRQRTVPVHLNFLDLFDSTFVRNNCDVFIVSPFWTMDPFFVNPPRKNPILEAARQQDLRQRLQPLPPHKRWILYDGLTKEGYDLGTYAEFDAKMENPEKVRALYNGITKDGYDVGSYEEFYAKVGPSRVLSPINRRYLMCIVKGLDAQGYLTSNQRNALGARCGTSEGETRVLEEQARQAMADAWMPPADAAEVYNPTAPKSDMITWEAALKQKGVAEKVIGSALARARDDTSIYMPLLIAVRGFLCDTVPNVELRSAFEYLEKRHVLHCSFEDLLFTLQNQPVPPRQETFDALARQREVVERLRDAERSARANLWSVAKQWSLVKRAAIVLFVLVWPLRLLVLGTRWALKTVRS